MRGIIITASQRTQRNNNRSTHHQSDDSNSSFIYGLESGPGIDQATGTATGECGGKDEILSRGTNCHFTQSPRWVFLSQQQRRRGPRLSLSLRLLFLPNSTRHMSSSSFAVIECLQHIWLFEDMRRHSWRRRREVEWIMHAGKEIQEKGQEIRSHQNWI